MHPNADKSPNSSGICEAISLTEGTNALWGACLYQSMCWLPGFLRTQGTATHIGAHANLTPSLFPTHLFPKLPLRVRSSSLTAPEQPPAFLTARPSSLLDVFSLLCLFSLLFLSAPPDASGCSIPPIYKKNLPHSHAVRQLCFYNLPIC